MQTFDSTSNQTGGKLLITQESVVATIMGTYKSFGLARAMADFEKLDSVLSSHVGWAETKIAVYNFFADIRKEEHERARREKLEELRAAAPVFNVTSQSSSESSSIGKAEIDEMKVDVKSPGNNIAKIIKLDKDDERRE